MNIVEFALRFKDMASSELRQFGTTARTTFANANNLAHQLAGHNRVLGQSYNALQTQIRAVENTIASSTIPRQIREARRELAALQRQASRHSGNINTGGSGSGSGGGLLGMAGMAKFAGPAAIATVAYAAGSFFGETFSKALERQQVLTSFSVLAGSQGAGDALSKDLIKYQKDTILGPEVFKNAQTMMGFGFKSTEVMPNMKMLGDISMGDPAKLGSLTLAFSQTRAAGKLMGQDLLQFVTAGFNPLQEMSKRTGKSMGDLRKEMENGNISFAMVQQAFKDATSEGGTFNNMLATIAKTPAGKMQALSGAWNEFKVSAGTAFMPLLSMAIEFGSKMLPMIESWMPAIATTVDILAGLVGLVKSFVGELSNGNPVLWTLVGVVSVLTISYNANKIAIMATDLWAKRLLVTQGLQAFWGGIIIAVTNLWTGAQWLLNAALNANPIGLMVLGIAALVAMIVVAIKYYDQWGAALTLIMGPFGMIINIIASFARHWDSITNAFTAGGFIAGIKRIGFVLIDALLMPVQQLLELLAKVPGMGNLAGAGAQKIQQMRTSLDVATFVKALPKAKEKKSTGKTNAELLADQQSLATQNASSAGKSESAISGGGPKTINITIQKFLDYINIHTTNLKAGEHDIESQMLEMFARVVTQGAQAI
jgi:tape measure domain-containing protein